MNTLLIDRKIKTLLILPMLLVSTFAIIGVDTVPPAYAVASLRILPAVITDTCSISGTGCTTGHGVGSTFQYTVVASGVGGDTGTVFAFQYEIHFNPLILQAVNVSSFGFFFDALLANFQAFPVTSIDNTNGVVTVAVTSEGLQSPSTLTTLPIGAIFFSVVGLGRSDQSLQNAILLHNAGGGVLNNIPATTIGAIFSNIGFFGKADFPCGANTPCIIAIRQAWPEDVLYSIAMDNSFTPGIVDLFGNVNSTGTLPVVVFIRFTLTSDFGTTMVQTTTHQYGPGEVSVVPQFTGFNPNPGGSGLEVGTFEVSAQLFFQQVNLDNTLGPVIPGETIKTFHFVVIPSNPSHTVVSCSPATGVTRRTLCTAVVDTMGTDPVSKLDGVVSFSDNQPGLFKPASCAVDNKGTCSVFLYPRSTADATVTATYSGDLGGSAGHTGSSGSTVITVSGHPTTTAVSCSPGTVNAPTRTTSTCTVTVTDVSATPENVTGTVTFRSSKFSFWNPTQAFCSNSGGGGIPCPGIFPACTLSPTSVTGVSTCTVVYRPTRTNAAVCNPSAGCTATITASYGVSNVPNTDGFFIPDGDLGDAVHLTSTGKTTIVVTGHQTRTTVKCTPSGVSVNATTTCTVTVTDTDSMSAVAPTGVVVFGHDGGLSPNGFDPNPCILSPVSGSTTKSSCSVTFSATSVAGEHTIFARYLGDSTHVRTTGHTTIKVI